MTPAETAKLLALIRRYDNRRIDDATVVAWHKILDDLEHTDCVSAVLEHFRKSATYLMPFHVRSGALSAVKARAAQRARAQLEAKLAIEAAEAGDRGVHDRSEEVHNALTELAKRLGPGRPDRMRRVETWKKGL